MEKNREKLEELFPDIPFLTADGFDEAIIGMDEKAGRVIYNYDKVISILVSGGMKEEEAMEYAEYNVVGSYAGEHTPIYANLIKEIPYQELESLIIAWSINGKQTAGTLTRKIIELLK